MIIGKIQIFKRVICHWLSYWQAGSCGLIFPCLSKAIYRLTLHVVITCEITWAIVMAFAYLAKINDVNVCRKCKVNRGLRVFFNGCPHFHTPASMNLKGGYIGFILTVRLSVLLWMKSCPFCILNNTCRIHFIFTHLIKQLQKVYHVQSALKKIQKIYVLAIFFNL